jgi:hypothetical protein
VEGRGGFTSIEVVWVAKLACSFLQVRVKWMLSLLVSTTTPFSLFLRGVWKICNRI